jgi:hypothetical protein
MIEQTDKTPELSQETRRLLAELAGSKYFDALNELLSMEFVNVAFSKFMVKGLSSDEKEYWTGYANAAVALLQRLKQINQEGYKDDN